MRNRIKRKKKIPRVMYRCCTTREKKNEKNEEKSKNNPKAYIFFRFLKH